MALKRKFQGEVSSTTLPDMEMAASTMDKYQERLQEVMRCPVCLDLPRGGEAYVCINGHIVCETCKEKVVAMCPVCRVSALWSICPFYKRIAAEFLSQIRAVCAYTASGCRHKLDLFLVSRHEEKCYYRPIYCPAKHRGTCQWEGSLITLCRHVQLHRCVQVLGSVDNNMVFTSHIADFASNESVFDCSVKTHWRPILFIQKGLTIFMVYMTIYREAGGYWYFSFRSFSPEYVLSKIYLNLSVYPAGNSKDAPVYKCLMTPVSSMLSEADALAKGQNLLLTDFQIKNLRDNVKTSTNQRCRLMLFGYNVTAKIQCTDYVY
jgi:hypothetical protein